MAKTPTSRLAEIIESQRRRGETGLSGITSAIGARLKEKSDIRGKLFGREGTSPTGLFQAIGRSIFGVGYSATGKRISGIGTKISKLSEMEGESLSSKILLSVDNKLGSIDRKIEIVAKTAIAQNRVARDINVMRQNIQLMAKNATGTSKTKADMYFMNARQRENEYERQFGKTTTLAGMPGEKPREEAKDKKESGFNPLKMIKTFAIGAALGGTIYTVFQTVEGLFKIFKDIEGFISEKIQPFMSAFLEWKTKWDTFNFKDWLDSVTPEELGSIINSITNFFKDSGSALSSEAAKLISKIPADSLSGLISTLIDNFLTVAKAIGSKLGEAFSSMNTEDLIKAATAGGLLALLFGGTGSSIIGGLLGKFLSSSLSSLATFIVSNPMAAAGILAALGLAKATSNIVSGDLGNTQENLPKQNDKNAPARSEFEFSKDLQKQFNTNLSQEEILTQMRKISPAYEQQFSGLINQYNQAGEGNQRESILRKMEPFFQTLKIDRSGTSSEDEYTKRVQKMAAAAQARGGKLTPDQMKWIKEQRGQPEQKVEKVSSTEMKTGEETSKTRLEKKLGQGFLTGADWDFYTNKLGQQESGNNYKADNGLGFVGRYQFGSEALETFEYLRPGMSKMYGATGSNAAVYHPDAWMPGWSLERFLNDTAAQDQTFMKFTKNNFNSLKNQGIITPDTTIADAQAWLYAAHHGGVGGAIELSKGNDIKDFAYADSSVGKSFKMMQSGTMTAGEGTFSGIGEKLAGAGAKISSAALETLDKAEDVILNVFNNMVNATQSQQAQADTKDIQDFLGTMDTEAMKDLLSPVTMKYTLTHL